MSRTLKNRRSRKAGKTKRRQQGGVAGMSSTLIKMRLFSKAELQEVYEYLATYNPRSDLFNWMKDQHTFSAFKHAYLLLKKDVKEQVYDEDDDYYDTPIFRINPAVMEDLTRFKDIVSMVYNERTLTPVERDLRKKQRHQKFAEVLQRIQKENLNYEKERNMNWRRAAEFEKRHPPAWAPSYYDRPWGNNHH